MSSTLRVVKKDQEYADFYKDVKEVELHPMGTCVIIRTASAGPQIIPLGPDVIRIECPRHAKFLSA